MVVRARARVSGKPLSEWTADLLSAAIEKKTPGPE